MSQRLREGLPRGMCGNFDLVWIGKCQQRYEALDATVVQLVAHYAPAWWFLHCDVEEL